MIKSIRKVHAGEIWLDSNTTAAVRMAIYQAFIFGFRLIMLFCAGLSVASAAVAWLMIPDKAEQLAIG